MRGTLETTWSRTFLMIRRAVLLLSCELRHKIVVIKLSEYMYNFYGALKKAYFEIAVIKLVIMNCDMPCLLCKSEK